jgi:hypothetical protein
VQTHIVAVRRRKSRSLRLDCRRPTAHAARLFGAAATWREKVGAVFPRGDERLYTPRLHATKATLGEATFTALWNEGRALSLEQAVAYALAEDDS